MGPHSQRPRPYLSEIDVLRVVTALAVVGVHTASFTLGFYRSPLGAQLQNGLVVALHFTRETFLSIAAFVLVYSYAGKPLALGTFWRKRGVGVLFPYVVWSFIYVWFAVPHDHPASWLRTALVATLTGNASYQLYYILLSLELYLTVPLLLPVVTRLGRRYPWRLVAASGVAQVLFFYFDHRFVEAAPFAPTPLGQFINAAQWRFLPCYQFYVVLGAVAALHVEQVRSFVLRRGRLLGLGLLLGLGALWLRYGVAIWIERQSEDYATSVFQPVMVPYAAAVTAFLYWLGVRWAARQSPAARSLSQRCWSTLSNASFGIYLIHAFILNQALRVVAPRLPGPWPAPLRVALIWLLVAGSAAGISVLCLYVPGLSRLVGRPWARPRPLSPPRRRGPSRAERGERAGTRPARGLALIIVGVAVVAAGALGGLISDRAAGATDHRQAPAPAGQAPTPEGRLAPGLQCQAAAPNSYQTCSFTDPQGKSLVFYLWVPAGYDPRAKYPLVLLLHGGGERAKPGNTPQQNRDLLLNREYVRVWGPGSQLPDDPGVQQHWPSFIVVPQLVLPNRWVAVPPGQGSYQLAPQPTDSLLLAKEIVDAVQRSYGVDPNRLYLTGLSIGGYGTWEASERWPGYFAAAAPIAGAGDPTKAAALVNLPIWAFHGAADQTVPVSGSRDMIAAIQAAGGHPRYSELPGVGHESWPYAYAILGKPTPTPGFFAWLFAQSKAA